MGAFSRIKTIAPKRLDTLLAAAARSPLSSQTTSYPSWYLQRWHFLPEGYLSPRSIRLYDRTIRRLYHSASERQTYRRTISLLRARRPDRLVEFGCGPGHALAALARTFPAANITGIDLSPFMLEAARTRAGARAELRHADASVPQFPGGEFDVVVAVHVLGHVPAPAAERMAAEARRILRPDGCLLTVDHRWHPEPAARCFERHSVATVGLGTSSLTLWTPTERCGAD